MFAPRPERVAAELVRVARPNGRIIMVNWTPSGFVGQMFKAIARHVPPPAGVPSAMLWGVEDTVRERLRDGIGRSSSPSAPIPSLTIRSAFLKSSSSIARITDRSIAPSLPWVLRVRNPSARIWKLYSQSTIAPPTAPPHLSLNSWK